MLDIISPLSFIESSIRLPVHPIAISPVIFPFSRVNIFINMIKCPLSACLVIYPLTIIASTIRPDLHSFTIPLITHPFSIIGGTTFKDENWTFLSRTHSYISNRRTAQFQIIKVLVIELLDYAIFFFFYSLLPNPIPPPYFLYFYGIFSVIFLFLLFIFYKNRKFNLLLSLILN